MHKIIGLGDSQREKATQTKTQRARDYCMSGSQGAAPASRKAGGPRASVCRAGGREVGGHRGSSRLPPTAYGEPVKGLQHENSTLRFLFPEGLAPTVWKMKQNTVKDQVRRLLIVKAKLPPITRDKTRTHTSEKE